MDNVFFYKKIEFGVNQYTSYHMKQQNINFTKKCVFSVSFKHRDFRVGAKNQQNSWAFCGNILGANCWTSGIYSLSFLTMTFDLY